VSAIKAYHKRHGHFPRALFPIGNNRFLRVEVAPGYLIIEAPPTATFYVPRRTTIKLLRWILPIVRYMDEEFNVEDAIHEYHEAEMEQLNALRAQKRARHQRRRRSA
jgi:hypothetical protein